MIHEGPLLEYARPRPRVPAVGRRRATLARARARRAGLPAASARSVVAARRPARHARRLCAALALVETLVAKMRVLLVPRLLAAGAVAALLGIAAWLVERHERRPRLDARRARAWSSSSCGAARSPSLSSPRRRSCSSGFALHDAKSSGDVLAAAPSALRAIGLAALFLLLVARTRETRPVRARVAAARARGHRGRLALALTWLVPEIGLDSRDAGRGVLALVAFGIVTAATAPGDAVPDPGHRARRERDRALGARAPGRGISCDRARRRVRPDRSLRWSPSSSTSGSSRSTALATAPS